MRVVGRHLKVRKIPTYEEERDQLLQLSEKIKQDQEQLARLTKKLHARMLHAFRARVQYSLYPMVGSTVLIVRRGTNPAVYLQNLQGWETTVDEDRNVNVKTIGESVLVRFGVHGQLLFLSHSNEPITVHSSCFDVCAELPDIGPAWKNPENFIALSPLSNTEADSVRELFYAGLRQRPAFSELLQWVERRCGSLNPFVEATLLLENDHE